MQDFDWPNYSCSESLECIVVALNQKTFVSSSSSPPHHLRLFVILPGPLIQRPLHWTAPILVVVSLSMSSESKSSPRCRPLVVVRCSGRFCESLNTSKYSTSRKTFLGVHSSRLKSENFYFFLVFSAPSYEAFHFPPGPSETETSPVNGPHFSRRLAFNVVRVRVQSPLSFPSCCPPILVGSRHPL